MTADTPDMREDARPLTYPAYRARSGGFAVPSLSVAALAMGMAQLARTGAPLPVLLGLPALVLVLIPLTYAAHRRTATITTPHHITVRTAFGTRTVAWPEIQAIEIEANPVSILATDVQREFVMVYDRRDGKILLPQLNGKSVPVLRDEVATLRALWERHRGENWSPGPEVAAKVAQSRRNTDRTSAWMVALGASMISLLLTVVTLVALLLNDVILSAAITWLVPAVVFLATLAISLSRRGRQREAAGR